MKTLFQTLCDLDAAQDPAIDAVINILADVYKLDPVYNRDDIIELIADFNLNTGRSAFDVVATGSCGVSPKTVRVTS